MTQPPRKCCWNQNSRPVCVCVWSLSLRRAYVQSCRLATAAFYRKKSEFNCSRSFHKFSRQIISGLCPLAPTLRPSRSLWSIIIRYSFELFIRSSLGWVEAKRNPLISGSWLYSLHGERRSCSGKQLSSGGRGEAGREDFFKPEHTSTWGEAASRAHTVRL